MDKSLRKELKRVLSKQGFKFYLNHKVKSAVAEVSKTVKNIDSVYVKDFKVHVENGKINSYGAICKVSFRVEGKIM